MSAWVPHALENRCSAAACKFNGAFMWRTQLRSVALIHNPRSNADFCIQRCVGQGFREKGAALILLAVEKEPGSLLS